MKLESVFRQLYQNQLIRDDYLETVPGDIVQAVYDNKYTNSILEDRDILLKTLFGDQAESIEWFLYEWRPGLEVGIDSEMTAINSIDDYIEWIKKYEGFQ